MLAMLGFFGATLLAFRFSVFILLPAILSGWLLTLVCEASTANTLTHTALQMVLVTTVLQLGYVAGIILKSALLANRSRGWSKKSTMVPDCTI